MMNFIFDSLHSISIDGRMIAIANMQLDITLQGSPKNGIFEILGHLRPDWDKADIYVNSMKGGHVNHLYECGLHGDVGKNDVVVVRIFGHGSDGIANREKEILCMRIGHYGAVASEIYCKFNNGIVYKYRRGCKVDFDNQTNEYVARGVAKKLAKMHSINYKQVLEILGEGDKISLYKSPHRLIGFLQMLLAGLPDNYEDQRKEKIRQEELMTKADAHAEVKRLEDLMDAMDFPLEFSHNDTNTGNIIYDEVAGEVHFVDWELSDVCYSFHDIGIYFCTHVYTAGVKCDPEQYKHYPSKEYQLRWIRWYLEYKAEQGSEDPKHVTQDQIRRMYVGANLMAMNWAVVITQWTLAQDIASPLSIDFFSIARHFQGIYRVIKRRLEDED